MSQEGCDPLLSVKFSPSGVKLAMLARSALYLYQVRNKNINARATALHLFMSDLKPAMLERYAFYIYQVSISSMA